MIADIIIATSIVWTATAVAYWVGALVDGRFPWR
jgi:hypothetical protein